MKKGISFLLVLTVALVLSVCASAAVLTLPAGTKSIEDEAFYGDKKLDQVVLPEGLTTIGSKAFAYSSVKKINLPESLTYIAGNAFTGVSNPVMVAVPASYAYGWAEPKGYTIEDRFPTLVTGSHGDRVLLVQQYLILLEYYSGEADGVFGTAMVNAVKQFQNSNGLTVNGKVNLAAWNKLKMLQKEKYPFMALGSHGASVRQVQEYLILLGYLSGEADGVFGTAMENAVKQYQREKDLAADGRVGLTTWIRLRESYVNEFPKMMRGCYGDDVRLVQEYLRALGYYSEEPDGTYGAVMELAVRQFERDHGLPADGIISRSVWIVIKQAYDQLPVILIQPADQSAGANTVVSFSVETENADSYQWEFSEDNGENWAELTNGLFWQGNRSDTLSFTAALDYDGYWFRVIVTGEGGSRASEPASLTIIPPPEFVVQPAGKTVEAGTLSFFQVLAVNANAYRWEISSDGDHWTAMTDNDIWMDTNRPILRFHASPDFDGYLFHAIAIGIGGETVSDSVMLTVLKKPVILTQPTDQSVVVGEEVTFSVDALYTDSYQWEYSWDGMDPWKSLTNSAFFVGNKTDTLTFNADNRYDGMFVRVSLTGKNTRTGQSVTVFSNPAVLTTKLPPPTSVSAIATDSRTISLSWEVSGDVEGVIIRIRSGNSDPYIYAREEAGTDWIMIPGLEPITRYYFYLSAYLGDKESDPYVVSTVTLAN